MKHRKTAHPRKEDEKRENQYVLYSSTLLCHVVPLLSKTIDFLLMFVSDIAVFFMEIRSFTGTSGITHECPKRSAPGMRPGAEKNTCAISVTA
ncbi:hypothetical protein ACQRBF_04765 [Peptoniphilaceae bacterium SGI.131]